MNHELRHSLDLIRRSVTHPVSDDFATQARLSICAEAIAKELAHAAAALIGQPDKQWFEWNPEQKARCRRMAERLITEIHQESRANAIELTVEEMENWNAKHALGLHDGVEPTIEEITREVCARYESNRQRLAGWPTPKGQS